MSENAFGGADQVRTARLLGSESDNDGGGVGQSDLPGHGNIELVYRRSWERDKMPARKFTLHVYTYT